MQSEQHNDLSYILFARPSFWRGVGRVWDFGNTYSVYNSSPTNEQADFYATWSDWRAVGNDLRAAMGTYEKSQEPLTSGRPARA